MAANPDDLKNIHKGDEMIIIANGPSLADVPLEFLKSRPTFGCNRITMMGHSDDFWPDYYLSVGGSSLGSTEQREHTRPSVLHAKAAFLCRVWDCYFPYDNVYGVLSWRIKDTDRLKISFSYTPLEFLGVGYSSVYCMLQIAFFMGVQRALIVGLDHRYPDLDGPDADKKHFYKDGEAPMFEISPGPYPVHMFFSGSDLVFTLADWHWSRDGRNILDLTPNGHCKIFRKDRLENWIR